jgi:leader peptidase (prepilin peptidase)/N-methyltransferase
MVLVFGFVLGSILGSFASAIADRSTKKASFWKRSYCVSCKHTLHWYDLFPILTYLFLRGRCRYCKAKIPSELFITELVMGVLVGMLFLISFPPLTTLVTYDPLQLIQFLDIPFKVYALTIMMILFITDLKTGLLPNRITYPAIITSFILLIVIAAIKSGVFYYQLSSTPFGAYLLPPYTDYFYTQIARLWWPVAWAILSGLGTALAFALLIIATRGRGMGWGDVKYVLFLGFVLGFPLILVALFLSFLTGALFSIGLILLGKKSFGQTIPFGPFLSLGSAIAIIWGQQLLTWYLQLS